MSDCDCPNCERERYNAEERKPGEVPKGKPEGFGYYLGGLTFYGVHAILIGMLLGLCAAAATITYRFLTS